MRLPGPNSPPHRRQKNPVLKMPEIRLPAPEFVPPIWFRSRGNRHSGKVISQRGFPFTSVPMSSEHDVAGTPAPMEMPASPFRNQIAEMPLPVAPKRVMRRPRRADALLPEMSVPMRSGNQIARVAEPSGRCAQSHFLKPVRAPGVSPPIKFPRRH